MTNRNRVVFSFTQAQWDVLVAVSKGEPIEDMANASRTVNNLLARRFLEEDGCNYRIGEPGRAMLALGAALMEVMP